MCTAGLCMVDSVGADAADAANIRDWRWRVVGFRAAVVNPSVVYSRTFITTYHPTGISAAEHEVPETTSSSIDLELSGFRLYDVWIAKYIYSKVSAFDTLLVF
ncbi:uncharacterized protein AFUA_4G13110 [Aspergillus fumigatus Af293]